MSEQKFEKIHTLVPQGVCFGGNGRILSIFENYIWSSGDHILQDRKLQKKKSPLDEKLDFTSEKSVMRLRSM